MLRFETCALPVGQQIGRAGEGREGRGGEGGHAHHWSRYIVDPLIVSICLFPSSLCVEWVIKHHRVCLLVPPYPIAAASYSWRPCEYKVHKPEHHKTKSHRIF